MDPGAPSFMKRSHAAENRSTTLPRFSTATWPRLLCPGSHQDDILSTSHSFPKIPLRLKAMRTQNRVEWYKNRNLGALLPDKWRRYGIGRSRLVL